MNPPLGLKKNISNRNAPFAGMFAGIQGHADILHKRKVFALFVISRRFIANNFDINVLFTSFRIRVYVTKMEAS